MSKNAVENQSKMWNLWHGCHKLSEGCRYCYVYRGDAKHKILICEPLLKPIDLNQYDIGSWVEQVVVGGESGYEARPCHFDWVLAIRDVCAKNHVSFRFKQTGAKFVKDGRLYHIKLQFQHSQARKAGINIEFSIVEDYIVTSARNTRHPQGTKHAFSRERSVAESGKNHTGLLRKLG